MRYALQGVPGVAEVASIGGFVRQYQVLLDPARLQSFGVTAPQIMSAVRSANQDVGARTVEVAGSDYAIRGLRLFPGHRGYRRRRRRVRRRGTTGPGRRCRPGDDRALTSASASRS